MYTNFHSKIKGARYIRVRVNIRINTVPKSTSGEQQPHQSKHPSISQDYFHLSKWNEYLVNNKN